MNVKKQIPGEASKLIRRTSSSIDEKSRTEAQTPTQMNKQKLNSVKAPVAITGAGNVQASQLIQSQQKEIKQETLTPHAPEVVNSTVTIKPKLTLNFEKRQIPVTQKAEVSNQIISSLSVNENSQPKIQTEQRKIPMNNNSNNQSTFAKLSPPTNPLLKSQPTLISNIQNQNKQLPIVQSTSLQAVNVPQPPQSEGQSNICKSDLSGKRSASSLKDLSDNEIIETTEKKIKPNSNQRDYDNLKKDIIKEMKIDEDMNEDCSSSVSSHATVVIKSSIISKTITPIDQLLSQEREDISRKTSDFSDDSQKSNTSSLTANSQESIQQALKKQRKRTEHLELKNKIDQNLSFIETKQDKIRRITQLVSEQLTPQMMKLLKETVQKQKELLYQSHGISEKKQNKINSKLLNQILSSNAQLLKDLKI